MSRIVFGLVTLCLAGSAVAQTDEKVFSGPQPGEKTPPFKVLGITGSQAGTDFDVIEEIKGRPALVMFVHELTRPASQLMRPLDLYGAKLAEDGFATHLVWLAADRSAAEDRVRAVQGAIQFKSPISISLDGIEGPGSYGLNRKVALTILVAKDNKVVANYAITQPNETDAPKILEAMAKLVGKTPPTLAELGADRANMRREPARPPAKTDTPTTDRPQVAAAESMKRLEDEVARLKSLDQEHHARAIARVAELEKLVGELIDALNDSRAKIAKLEGSPAPSPLKKPALPAAPAASRDAPSRSVGTPKKPGAELPGRTPDDPELIGLMRKMIQPSNDEASVKEINEAMLKWAGDNPQRKDDLKQFAVRIAHLGYGSDAAKTSIKKLARE